MISWWWKGVHHKIHVFCWPSRPRRSIWIPCSYKLKQLLSSQYRIDYSKSVSYSLHNIIIWLFFMRVSYDFAWKQSVKSRHCMNEPVRERARKHTFGSVYNAEGLNELKSMWLGPCLSILIIMNNYHNRFDYLYFTEKFITPCSYQLKIIKKVHSNVDIFFMFQWF